LNVDSGWGALRNRAKELLAEDEKDPAGGAPRGEDVLPDGERLITFTPI